MIKADPEVFIFEFGGLVNGARNMDESNVRGNKGGAMVKGQLLSYLREEFQKVIQQVLP